MTHSDPSPHLREEPQSERGAPGSRDEGGPPGGGATERPAGDPHEASTGVDPPGTDQDDPAGDPAGRPGLAP